MIVVGGYYAVYVLSSYVAYCMFLAQTAKGAKIYSAAVAATADGQTGKEGEEKVKLHTHSYCCLDYAQVNLSTNNSLTVALPLFGCIAQRIENQCCVTCFPGIFFIQLIEVPAPSYINI